MSKIKNFSAKLEVRNVKLRLSISVIFLLLIIPVFMAFILYSYQTNYSIYKKNAIDLVTRANDESIHNLIDFLDPIADAARVTAKLVNSNPELINQDKIADHNLNN
jgi:cell shape-determining protein MreC